MEELCLSIFEGACLEPREMHMLSKLSTTVAYPSTHKSLNTQHFLLIFYTLYLVIFMCMSVSLHMCVVQCIWRPENMFDPLEMDLQVVVQHHVGAKNQT